MLDVNLIPDHFKEMNPENLKQIYISEYREFLKIKEEIIKKRAL